MSVYLSLSDVSIEILYPEEFLSTSSKYLKKINSVCEKVGDTYRKVEKGMKIRSIKDKEESKPACYK